MDLSERVAQLSKGAAQRLQVRSAMNPMLWLVGIGSPVCWGFAFLFRDYEVLRTLLAVGGMLPVLVSCAGFVYFALARPEKLQSEDYQIRHQTLQIIRQKASRIELDPASLVEIADSRRRKIEAGEDESS